MFEPLSDVLAASPFVAYGLVFGSAAKGTAHAFSDTDVAIGTFRAPTSLELGELRSSLERAAEGQVHVVLMDEAGPALAYRIFRDGKVIFERDGRRLVDRRARAFLEYLDLRPIEELCIEGVLRARHGR